MIKKMKCEIILLFTILAGFSNLLFVPLVVAEVDAFDMLLDIEGYDLSADLYSYSDYISMLDEIGVVPSNFILGKEPVAVVLASYQKENAYVWLEILEFASIDDAHEEYALQAEDVEYISGLGYQGNNGPLYQRFIPRERVFVHDKFLFLIFYSPLDNQDAYNYMDDLLPILVSNLLETIDTSSPEPPGYSLDASWGLEAGDVISWIVSDSTFTGSLGTGTSSSQGEWEGILEVIEIKNGHLLIKKNRIINYILTEDETRVSVNIPYDQYYWISPNEEGLSIESDDGSSSEIVLFPLEINGVPLVDLVYGSIEHLPERDISETDEYISVHGNTRSYSGFTPIETSWKDVTVHRGTGIVTSSDFYYNNNEYSITTSAGVTLEYTNFDLGSRMPILLSLTASSSLSSSTVSEGDSVILNVLVVDQEGVAVKEAEVTCNFYGVDFILLHKTLGNYEATLSTDDLVEGTYDITILVEKEEYTSITDTDTVIIQKKEASQPNNDSSAKTGIPGFPLISLSLGFILTFLILTNLNVKKGI